MPYPIHFTAEYPERLSRVILILRLLFSPLYVAIPHGVCLAGYGLAMFAVAIVAWFAVLFTGRYPQSMFEFVVGWHRWAARVRAYIFFLTDVYPPFSNKE